MRRESYTNKKDNAKHRRELTRSESCQSHRRRSKQPSSSTSLVEVGGWRQLFFYLNVLCPRSGDLFGGEKLTRDKSRSSTFRLAPAPKMKLNEIECDASEKHSLPDASEKSEFFAGSPLATHCFLSWVWLSSTTLQEGYMV
jgi:hypothetical protein